MTDLHAESQAYIKSLQSPLDIQVGGDHYKSLKIQPVEYILANGLGFCEGNVVKYVTRRRDKGGAQDLQKIKHFVDILLADEERKVKETYKLP